jgi:hypothetical protein
LFLMVAEAKKIGEQIPPDVDYADALRKWSKVEMERTYNAVLGAKAK